MLLTQEQPWWGHGGTEKSYTVDIRIKPWMLSLEFLRYCVKSEHFFHNYSFIACSLYFFGTFCACMKSHSCADIGVVVGESPWQWRWRRYVELLYLIFECPVRPPHHNNPSHIWNSFILIALNPPRCSELHMWSSLWEKAPRFAEYWPGQNVLKSNCTVNIACQRSSFERVVRKFVFE